MKVIVHIYSVKGRFYTEPLIIEVNINTLVPCCTIGIFTNDRFRFTEVTKTSLAIRLIRWPQSRDKCMHKKSMDIKYWQILQTSIAIYCLPHLDRYSCWRKRKFSPGMVPLKRAAVYRLCGCTENCIITLFSHIYSTQILIFLQQVTEAQTRICPCSKRQLHRKPHPISWPAWLSHCERETKKEESVPPS